MTTSMVIAAILVTAYVRRRYFPPHTGSVLMLRSIEEMAYLGAGIGLVVWAVVNVAAALR
ncbi:hypothetical protein OG563_26305 [Nocardia vinacea]|uniref:Uncharacterized protein n=1 Tax=Nocardia vinacea TaxID=96468 RepID=A0ABZ1YHR1_9NOCA|nr:hypothetical protein [Nocardia vinacea]